MNKLSQWIHERLPTHLTDCLKSNKRQQSHFYDEINVNNHINLYERCVLCNTETNVLKSTRIDLRVNYIEGSGQLCCECYKSL